MRSTEAIKSSFFSPSGPPANLHNGAVALSRRGRHNSHLPGPLASVPRRRCRGRHTVLRPQWRRMPTRITPPSPILLHSRGAIGRPANRSSFLRAVAIAAVTGAGRLPLTWFPLVRDRLSLILIIITSIDYCWWLACCVVPRRCVERLR